MGRLLKHTILVCLLIQCATRSPPDEAPSNRTNKLNTKTNNTVSIYQPIDITSTDLWQISLTQASPQLRTRPSTNVATRLNKGKTLLYLLSRTYWKQIPTKATYLQHCLHPNHRRELSPGELGYAGLTAQAGPGCLHSPIAHPEGTEGHAEAEADSRNTSPPQENHAQTPSGVGDDTPLQNSQTPNNSGTIATPEKKPQEASLVNTQIQSLSTPPKEVQMKQLSKSENTSSDNPGKAPPPRGRPTREAGAHHEMVHNNFH